MNVAPARLVTILLEVLIALCGAFISIFKLDGQPAMVAGFFTLVYAAITIKLEMHFSTEDRLFAKFPVLHALRNTPVDVDLIETLNRYHSISHPLLLEIKKSAWNQFSAEVNSLHDSKRSENLLPAEYIAFIEGELERAPPKTRVIAVSVYAPEEFIDNSYELNFHQAQLKATARQVSIERIFVCARSRMEDLKSTPFWSAHLDQFDGRFADERDVQSAGITVKRGFIMIGQTLFADQPQQRGLTGTVSTNELDVEKATKEFAALERHARPIRDVFPQ